MGHATALPATSRSPLAAVAQEYLDAGYHVIPILPQQKVPGEYTRGRWNTFTGWTAYKNRKPEAFTLRKWMSWEGTNIGVPLGVRVNGYQLVAIDFDTDDPNQLKSLGECLPASPMRKRGARGFTAFYLAPLGARTKSYKINGTMVLEVLTGNATRQTVMPPSIHPEGIAYEYEAGTGIVPIDQLPVLTDGHFMRLEATLTELGWENKEPKPSAVPPKFTTDFANDNQDPTIWRDTNNLALERLEAWCPELPLTKLKRRSNGYEAVPHWRPSSTGRPLPQRKPSLKIHRKGHYGHGERRHLHGPQSCLQGIQLESR